jgi:hypothetical protein
VTNGKAKQKETKHLLFFPSFSKPLERSWCEEMRVVAMLTISVATMERLEAQDRG